MWEDPKERGIQYMDAKIAMLSAALKVVALQTCLRKNMGLSWSLKLNKGEGLD